MSKNTKSHIYIGLDQALNLLTNEREDRMPNARNEGEALDILNYFGIIEVDVRDRKVGDVQDIRAAIYYLDVSSRYLNKSLEQQPDKGIFQRLYEKELVRNLSEFNDFWHWTDQSRDEMEELQDELKILAHSYVQYNAARLKKKQRAIHKGRKKGKTRKKSGTGKVRAD